MRAQVQFEPAPPPVLPDFITQHLDPFSGDDDTADIDAARGTVSDLPPLQHPAAARCRSGMTAARSSKRRSAATRHVRAARARSTSIATDSWRDAGRRPAALAARDRPDAR